VNVTPFDHREAYSLKLEIGNKVMEISIANEGKLGQELTKRGDEVRWEKRQKSIKYEAATKWRTGTPWGKGAIGG